MKSREHGGVGSCFITRMTEVTTKEKTVPRRDINANQVVLPHFFASNTLSSFPKETTLQEDTQKPSVRKKESKAKRGKRKEQLTRTFRDTLWVPRLTIPEMGNPTVLTAGKALVE